ncbi:MAG: multiheme c-type cytochrome [Proteobacteria bacterium]|nr:multiheme c-type cytochrome [Pseudomonadota bacterium]
MDAALAVVEVDGGPGASPDAGLEKTFATGAGRCGECHEKMFDEWEDTAHAAAARSPLYVAAITKVADKQCGERCHTPLVARLGKGILASEGVTCDVCHTMRDLQPSARGANFSLALGDMVKFGPRCDLKDHYFHRMGCSPEHREAAVCGGCHWWQRGSVPVFTEYADWRDVYARADRPCQTCHMPKERAAIAVGSPVRAGVPHHGWLGVTRDLRVRAVALAVAVAVKDAGLAVDVTVTNVGAGHYIPSGLPERRLLVRAQLVDGKGAALGEQAWWLGRELVDDAGKPAAFWDATKVGADSRIAPGKAWHETWSGAAAAGAVAVEVEVRYRAASPELATLLGVTELVDQQLAHARVSLARLPASAQTRPPKAGTRPGPRERPRPR